MFFLNILIFLLFLVTHSEAAPFQNGGFEDDSSLWVTDQCNSSTCTDRVTNTEQKLTGWTVETLAGCCLDWWKYNGSYYPRTGNYFIELNGIPGLMRVHQTFDTFPGKPYLLQLYLNSRGSSSSIDDKVKYRICSDSTCTSSYTTPSAGVTLTTSVESWTLFKGTFTPTTTTTYFSLENTINSIVGVLIDDISIKELPEFTLSSNMYVYDPTNGNLKAIPNQEIIYDWGVLNTAGSPDSGTFSLVMNVPSHTSFKTGSVTFVDGEIPGTPTGNPLTSGNTSPNLTNAGIGTVQYSSIGSGGPWTYTPSGTYDSNVRAIKITPSGIISDGNTTPVGFRSYFKALIQ